jgi:hypothetical protein
VNKSKEISKKFEVYLFQIQVDSGGKVSILGGDSIGHCEKKKSSREHTANSEWLLSADWIFVCRVR